MNNQAQHIKILVVAEAETALEKGDLSVLKTNRRVHLQRANTSAELEQLLTHEAWDGLLCPFYADSGNVMDIVKKASAIAPELSIAAVGRQVPGAAVAAFMALHPAYRYIEEEQKQEAFQSFQSWLAFLEKNQREKTCADTKCLNSLLFQKHAHCFEELNANIIGIFRWHMDGRILEANATFLKMMGYTREDFEREGLNWRKITAPRFHKDDDKAIEQLKQCGLALAYEKQYIRKDGSKVDILLDSLYLESADTGIALILDISRLKADEQKLQEIQANLLNAQRIALLGCWDYNALEEELHCSDEFYRILDLPKGVPLHDRQSFLRLVHPEDRDRWEQALDDALNRKKPYTIEYRIVRSDGEVRHIHAQGEALFTEDDQLKRIHGTIQDITERKRIEESLMRLTVQQEALLNNMPDLVWMKDADFKFIAINEPVEKFLGHSRDEILGRPLSDFVPPEYAARQLEIDHEVMRTGRRITVEDPFTTEDGRKIWFEISRSPIFNSAGEVIGLTGTGKDVTQRKEYEEAMLRSNELLEKKVEERTRELQAANRTLKENERLRSTFVSSLTHDLRTPLIAQKRLIELLLAQCGKEDSKISFLSQGLMENNENLLDMVGKLLETYQYAEGKIALQTEQFDLRVLVEECCEILKGMALSNNVRIINEVSPEFAPIVADRSLIRRLLINLLGNAVENIFPGCHVTVKALSMQDKIQIDVIDDGPGIEPEFIPYMFHRYSPRSRHSQKPGSGLGLFICKTIVELHQGTITVASKPGEGATFTVRLPQEQTVEQEPCGIALRKEAP
jgi:PAS domain S-box-containing protein